MEFKKGEIFYYYISYEEDFFPGLAKVEVERDCESRFGISVALKIVELYTNAYRNSKTKEGYCGNPERIKVGNIVSANEFQGVGASGFIKYFVSSEEELLKRVFHENK